MPVKNLADRALAYGTQSIIADGNDVVAVYKTAGAAVDECRAGRGPMLIEVKTMRMKGHAQHDPAEYVPKEMFEYWKTRDPIALYEKYLSEKKHWDAKKAEIDARIEQELDEDRSSPKNLRCLRGNCRTRRLLRGCHTIEAEWPRPKKKSCRLPRAWAAWKVPDFGAPPSETPSCQRARFLPLRVAILPKPVLCSSQAFC